MSDQNNVQDSMHYKDCRSGMLTNGIERAAHRALLYTVPAWRSGTCTSRSLPS